jgi:hypothetical protein
MTKGGECGCGAQGRVADATNKTTTYAEVRANNVCLNGKDNQERFPHLWPPPDPESRSPRTWEGAGASEMDRSGDLIENTNTPATEKIQDRICENCGARGIGGAP